MPLLRSEKEYNTKSIIIFYDLETTGLNPYHDEIGAIRLYDAQIKKFSELICCQKEIPPEITVISKVDIIDKPTIDIVMNHFIDYILELNSYHIYLIAHNNDAFDALFKKKNIVKYCHSKSSIIHKIKFIDTLRLSQKLLPNRYSYNMCSLCKLYNIEQIKAYRALNDVETLFHLYSNLCKQMYSHYLLENEEELLYKPDLMYKYIHQYQSNSYIFFSLICFY